MTHKTPSLRTRLAYTQHGSAIRFSWIYIRQAKFASLLTFLVLGGALALPTIFGLFVANLSQVNLAKGDANSLTLYLQPNIRGGFTKFLRS